MPTRGPATVAAPWDQGFLRFQVNRGGGATMAPPYVLGFLVCGVNLAVVPSIRRNRLTWEDLLGRITVVPNRHHRPIWDKEVWW